MFTQDRDTFSEVTDIVLYRYNSIDAKIWSLIKRTSNYRELDVDSILVDVSTLRSILLTYFRSDINKFQAVETSMIYKEATSTYFIWKMLEDIKNLRWVKIDLIKNAGYSRIVRVDEMKTIKFSIKIIRGTFRTFDHFNRQQLPHINSILLRSKILKDNSHYGVIKLGDMLRLLDMFLSEHNTSENAQAILPIIEALELFENDNPEVLVITDYDSDI
jgi:hypothetical protein